IVGNKDGSASQRSIMVVRVGIIVGLILAVTLGYYARGGYIIARATAIFFGLCGAMFLPAFVGGLFWKRATKAGALASMVVGFVVSGFWLTFIKEAEAGALGMVRMITGGPNSLLHAYPNWPVVDPLIVALPISALSFIVVSLCTRKPDQDHIQKCFGK
ncbi:MAG: sodium:solute symporter family protein, partial [Phycisphaerales bacterium]|nr:sodium:solute symporter family protein [Phycisphaerales bacterium]